MFKVPLWVEKGPRVVFQASVKTVLGGYGGSVARPSLGVQGGGWKKMTRGVYARGATGVTSGGLYGPRRHPFFEFQNRAGIGPGATTSGHGLQKSFLNGPVGVTKLAQNSNGYKRSDAK